MKIFDFQGRKGAVKIKTELCISTIISFSQVGPFPSQVKANKDHKGPSTELAVFLPTPGCADTRSRAGLGGDLRFNWISGGPLMLGENVSLCWCL